MNINVFITKREINIKSSNLPYPVKRLKETKKTFVIVNNFKAALYLIENKMDVKRIIFDENMEGEISRCEIVDFCQRNKIFFQVLFKNKSYA